MTEPLIAVEWDDDGRRTVHRWVSYEQLAVAYWSEWAARGDLPGSVWPEDAPAIGFVTEVVLRHAIDVLALVRALVDAAPDDESLRLLGAGPLEDLLRDERSDDDFLDVIEGIAERDLRFKTALSGGWVGREVEASRRTRLLALGFTHPGDPHPGTP